MPSRAPPDERRTILVVTHEVEPFLRHDPRIVLLDTTSGKLRDVTREELNAYYRRSAAVLEDRERTSAVQPPPTFLQRLMPFLEGPGQAAMILLRAVAAPFAGWRRPRWKGRYLVHYLRMVALGPTIIYVAIAGALLGFVSVSFTFRELPYGQVTVPLLTEEFLAATGYSSFRVLIPLLISLLLSAKCGAAVAADLGARRLTHQYEALRSFGAHPEHYYYGNIVLAMIVAAPLLTTIAFFYGSYASLLGFLFASDEATPMVFHRNYYATLWPADHAWPKGAGWVLLKMAGSGLLIAALSYAIGSRPKQSAADVSRDVGRTIFWASLAVLALHSLFSFIEF
jgi:ABC-type transporter Mla maintaining outer membrane lipid asymmetry permease subunit MlaE